MWHEDDDLEASYLIPDPRHPDHPNNKRKSDRQAEPNLWRRYDRDRRLQQAIVDLKPQVTAVVEAARATAALPENAIERTAVGAMFDALWSRIYAACDALGSVNDPAQTISQYLIERVFPAEFVSEALATDRNAAIRLFIRVHDEGVMFHMVFTDARPVDRAAYDALIANAQDHIGLRRPNNSGRPKREHVQPDSGRTDPRVVARLAAQDRDDADVAAALHAVYPNDGWDYFHQRADNLARRIKEYIDAASRMKAGP